MTVTRSILLALLVVSLTACGGHDDHFNFISLSSSSIDNGAIKVAGDAVTLHPDGAADARIESNGDFSIDGKSIAITPSERQLLQTYYASAVHVREHGLETGKAGVAVAGDALKQAAGQVLGRDDEAASQEHVADKVTQAAMKICDDLADIRAAQNQLAAQLGAFKPYGQLLGADSVNDCRKDD